MKTTTIELNTTTIELNTTTIELKSNIFFGYNTSPLDQFAIRNLLSLDAPILGEANISLTNMGLYLTISAFIIISLYLISNNYNKVVSNN